MYNNAYFVWNLSLHFWIKIFPLNNIHKKCNLFKEFYNKIIKVLDANDLKLHETNNFFIYKFHKLEQCLVRFKNFQISPFYGSTADSH